MYRMLSHGLSPCYIAKDLQRFGTCHALKHRFAQVRAAPPYTKGVILNIDTGVELFLASN